MRLVSVFVRSSNFRMGAVALAAFMLGSATVVTAAAIPITRVVDRFDANKAAAVNENGNVSVLAANTDYPDAGSQTRLGNIQTNTDKLTFDTQSNLKVSSSGTSTVSGSVSVTNLPATQPVSGTVNVGNLPADQQIHGSVTVSNFPPAASGGATIISLPTLSNVASNALTRWYPVDTSSCRSFAVAIAGTTGSVQYLGIFADSTPGRRVEADLKENNGYAFPVQPFTNEPFYAPTIDIAVYNKASTAQDINGVVFCQH